MASVYKLSAQLLAHEQDVRAVVAPSNDVIYSASRDQKVIAWKRDSNNTFSVKHTFTGHASFVNSITFLPPTSDHPQGLVVSGSSDKTINVYEPEIPGEPVYTLLGHTDNVCVLDVTKSGEIVSGSWDKTAKVWKDWKCVQTLTGHTAAVWAVCALSNGDIVTGSADKSVKLWKAGKCVHNFTGHTDCVRAIKELPGIGFASCSNDGSIRVWSLDGKCLYELFGHTSFVYSVTRVPNGANSNDSGLLASCGEDRSLRVWQGTQPLQTIMMPCVSVWCSTALPNGDIVVGGSDSVVRIFTKSPDRVASPDTIQQFDAAVASHAIPTEQVGDIDKSKLAGYEALTQPGKKDGQVIMVKTDKGGVEAHQWSAAQGTWSKIGDVVDAVGSNRKQVYEGKEYDYVFSVDMGEGVSLKLPYNVADNPYSAAQDFIWKHELSQEFLDQIAQFITTNAKGAATIGAGGSSSGGSGGFVDPFTGANRYVPSASSVPSASAAPAAPTLQQQAALSSSASNVYTPADTYVTFKAANVSAILMKLLQLNTDVEKSMEGVGISGAEEALLEGLTKSLDSPTTEQLKALERVSFSWPVNARFPGLDLVRLVLASPAGGARLFQLVSSPKVLLERMMDSVGWSTPTSHTPSTTTNTVAAASAVSKEVLNNGMLVLRGLANAFVVRDLGLDALWELRHAIFKWTVKFMEATGNNNKNVRLAAITLFLNYAVLLRVRGDEDLKKELMKYVTSFLQTETDAENQFRAVVTMGTLVHSSSTMKVVAAGCNCAQTLSMAIASAGLAPQEVKVKDAANEVLRVLV